MASVDNPLALPIYHLDRLNRKGWSGQPMTQSYLPKGLLAYFPV